VTYSIAKAAAETGLSIDTLRYYERIGLVEPPARDSGGRRTYSDEDLAWLHFLTRLRTTGMPIRMMREYAQLRHRGDGTAARRRQILVEHRAEVRERMISKFPNLVLNAVIRESIRLAEAPSFGLPISAYAPRSHGAADYKALAAEIVASR